MATTAHNNDISKDLDELRADLHKLREDLTKTTQNAYEASRVKAAEVGEQARETATETVDHVRECVNERPLTSLLVAAGMGALAGLLFRSR